MQKLSRIQKYEELRKSIELDNNINNKVNDNSNNKSDELLHSFDASILKKADIKEESTGKREKKENLTNLKTTSSDDTFTNEYLDDFLKEVRDYNIRKGTRQCENTEVDILCQLDDANRIKRNKYVHEIKNDENEYLFNDSNNIETVLSKEQIAEEVKNLLSEDDENLKMQEDDITEVEEIIENEADNNSTVENAEEIMEADTSEINKTIDSENNFISDTLLNENVDEETDENQQTTLHQKFLEETQQIRIQMNEYEDELTDLSDGVEKTAKLLNFVLGFLILVLLVVIGFIGFSIWNIGGF